jgi:AdoMet-dependent heme synthase
MKHPTIELKHVDNLWFQVTGTLCNIACTHCFNGSGPGVKTFGFLSVDRVRAEIETAVGMGVKEVFFTGGEPFLHPQLLEMLGLSIAVAPTTVLTNGTLINDAVADALARIERQARYSLEIRVSLDGHTEEMNDVIRGRGVFRRALEATARLSQRGLLPLVTIVRTWSDEEELSTLAGFVRTLKGAGYSKPRIKVIPALPLGRELTRLETRVETASHDEVLTDEMLVGFDRDLLMCSNSRLVTDRGVWVCPLLVDMPDARLGASLATAAPQYELRHRACTRCYQYGTICGNISAQIEGPAPVAANVGALQAGSTPEPKHP